MLNRTQSNAIKLTYFIFDNYFDMGNWFNVCAIRKIAAAYQIITPRFTFDSETIIAFHDNVGLVLYATLKDLLKDIAFYIAEDSITALEYEEVKEQLNKLNNDNILFMQFDADFQDLQLFNTTEQIKEYIENNLPEEDQEEALKCIEL